MFRGELVPCFEVPARADFVLQELVRRRVGSVLPSKESSTPRTPPLRQPSDQPAHQSSPQLAHQPADRPTAVSALGFEAALTIIHTPRYLEFLAHAWDEWVALDPANASKDAFPLLWPVRSFRTYVLPA